MIAGMGRRAASRQNTPFASIWPPDGNRARSWQAQVGWVRVVFGSERLVELGGLARELAASRVLLVTDSGLRSAGHVEAAENALRSADLQVSSFDEVSENPTTHQVAAGAAFAHRWNPDLIVALGGGSVMDCAKGINFLLTNGGAIADYWGFGRATKPLLPAIGIPTTAGTGSEAQSFALISDPDSHRKMACGDSKARFRTVILDPALTASVPVETAAAAGLDAVAHCVESFVTTRRSPISQMLASTAWGLLEARLQASLAEGAGTELRGDVLLAAHLAGAAIEQSMLGAAHACANPLTATFGIRHGAAVAIVLPAVVRFNAVSMAADYRQLLAWAGLEPSEAPGEALAKRLEGLREAAGLPAALGTLGIGRAELPTLASAAAREWTARFNPRPVGPTELLRIYEAAF